MALRKFIIEREIPKVGTFEREQLRGAAAKSNACRSWRSPSPASRAWTLIFSRPTWTSASGKARR